MYLTDVKVRLFGGPNKFAGRVELLLGGIWGTVSDVGFDFREGQVVCRQLGYEGVAGVFTGTRYGRGKGPIWLSNLDCEGIEPSIEQCSHPGWSHADATHSHDVSIECRIAGSSTGKSWKWKQIRAICFKCRNTFL